MFPEEFPFVEVDDTVDIRVVGHDVDIHRAGDQPNLTIGEPAPETAKKRDNTEHIPKLIVLANDEYSPDGARIKVG